MAPVEPLPVLPNARDAVLALHHAERALRLHPGEPQLFHTAMRQCQASVAAATAEHALELGLSAGAVHVHGVPVLSFGPAEAPFGPLRAAGIGELVLQRGLPPAAIETLVRRLAAIGNGAADLAVLADTAGLPCVQLRAATMSEDRTDLTALDWSPAPPTSPIAGVLRPRLERELGANLVAVAARQLLEDLAADSPAIDDLLMALFARMLRDDDFASAAWLLTEVSNQPLLPPDVPARLTTMAQQHVDAAWLQRRLHDATRDELLGLTAFVMQLGDEAAARFARAAAANDHPLSSWLCAMLGQQP